MFYNASHFDYKFSLFLSKLDPSNLGSVEFVKREMSHCLDGGTLDPSKEIKINDSDINKLHELSPSPELCWCPQCQCWLLCVPPYCLEGHLVIPFNL
jgi:hypothetical protein